MPWSALPIEIQDLILEEAIGPAPSGYQIFQDLHRAVTKRSAIVASLRLVCSRWDAFVKPIAYCWVIQQLQGGFKIDDLLRNEDLFSSIAPLVRHISIPFRNYSRKFVDTPLLEQARRFPKLESIKYVEWPQDIAAAGSSRPLELDHFGLVFDYDNDEELDPYEDDMASFILGGVSEVVNLDRLRSLDLNNETELIPVGDLGALIANIPKLEQLTLAFWSTQVSSDELCAPLRAASQQLIVLNLIILDDTEYMPHPAYTLDSLSLPRLERLGLMRPIPLPELPRLREISFFSGSSLDTYSVSELLDSVTQLLEVVGPFSNVRTILERLQLKPTVTTDGKIDVAFQCLRTIVLPRLDGEIMLEHFEFHPHILAIAAALTEVDIQLVGFDGRRVQQPA